MNRFANKRYYEKTRTSSLRTKVPPLASPPSNDPPKRDQVQNDLIQYRDSGNTKYRDKIVNDNYKAIKRIAENFALRYPDFEASDFIQESALGFIKGLDTYDFEKAVTRNGTAKVVSHALNYSIKYILQYIESHFSTVNIPRGEFRAAKKVRKTIEALEQRSEYVPPIDILLEDYSPAERIGAIHALNAIVYDATNEDGESIVLGSLAAPECSKESDLQAIHNARISIIETTCANLLSSEREILYASVGIDGYDKAVIMAKYRLDEYYFTIRVAKILKGLKSPQISLF